MVEMRCGLEFSGYDWGYIGRWHGISGTCAKNHGLWEEIDIGSLLLVKLQMCEVCD